MCSFSLLFFFFKQKTAYDLRISDWSSDVCSSDLPGFPQLLRATRPFRIDFTPAVGQAQQPALIARRGARIARPIGIDQRYLRPCLTKRQRRPAAERAGTDHHHVGQVAVDRSEEHTSELKSLMRISYAVFCLKKKKI